MEIFNGAAVFAMYIISNLAWCCLALWQSSRESSRRRAAEAARDDAIRQVHELKLSNDWLRHRNLELLVKSDLRGQVEQCIERLEED